MDRKTQGLSTHFSKLALPVLEKARVQEMDSYIQHGTTTTLDHVVSVAWEAYVLSHKLHIPCDEAALVRGALLHDYYLYDWHDHTNCPTRWHGFTHPGIALRKAEQDFDLTECERDLIAHHMWPLTPIPPHHIEAWLVCAADKLVSLRETIGGRLSGPNTLSRPISAGRSQR